MSLLKKSYNSYIIFSQKNIAFIIEVAWWPSQMRGHHLCYVESGCEIKLPFHGYHILY
jgi:hypothetical protein